MRSFRPPPTVNHHENNKEDQRSRQDKNKKLDKLQAELNVLKKKMEDMTQGLKTTSSYYDDKIKNVSGSMELIDKMEKKLTANLASMNFDSLQNQIESIKENLGKSIEDQKKTAANKFDS